MTPHVHCHNCGLPMPVDARVCDTCNATARPPAVTFPPLRESANAEADPRVTVPSRRDGKSDPRRTHGG